MHDAVVDMTEADLVVPLKRGRCASGPGQAQPLGDSA